MDPVRFSPRLQRQHRRIDADAWENIYIVGDVHGCLDTFQRLLDTLGVGPTDLVVCVGDLVRKGPDSEGVVDFVRGRENVISVRGNNEAKLLRGEATIPALDGTDRAWLGGLPLAISWGDTLVVHGGVDPDEPLPTHDPETLLTMRSHHGKGYDGPFWFDVYEGPPRVFFGHTVVQRPLEREWAVGLDTGCVYGGSLTAYDTARGRFVSVDPAETHRERPAKKFVSPRCQV